MNGKINFGRDYLQVASELQFRSKQQALDPVSFAAAKFFLLQWGLSTSEVDEINKVFWDAAEAGQLEDLEVVMGRLVKHVSNDPLAKERLLTQLVAIAYLDYDVTADEAEFVKWFQFDLDLKPSEFMNLVDTGNNLAIGLRFFAEEFKRSHT